jgi:NAD(P)-dependent dehydrogenase (short-subunit alcohol dehydrogenase family)
MQDINLYRSYLDSATLENLTKEKEAMTRGILITGGSRGISAATALRAAEKGYAVCISYRENRLAADRIIHQIESSGGRAIAVQADVCSEADVLRLFEVIDQTFGTLNALVNNAGISAPARRVIDIDADRLQKIFATNVIGAFLCTREAIRRMSIDRGGAGGAIVNVSSVAARLGSPAEYVDYAASKGAIDTMTIGLATEVAAAGIRVNAVRPGFVHTEIHAAMGEPNRLERIKPAIPMRRGGTAIEVANAILWLLSEEASYCTGAIVDVTGGR